MNRQSRSQLAEETLSILQSGEYRLPSGSAVSIAAPLAASCAATTLVLPEDYPAMLQQVEATPALGEATINVSNRTTLEAGRDLFERYSRVACLNFASAKNPGGGFLSGSQAQEESLARASGLVTSLHTQPEYYDFHRACRTTMYSDRAIFSPGVPVFRDDSGQLLRLPWQCDFITAAAVNAGAVRRNEPEHERDIVGAMEQRTRVVLSIAILNGCRVLVLGAWGCGVFQNDPATIADIFARVLQEAPFTNRFEHLEFAVYDSRAAQATFLAFQQQFSPS
jgi:uncharacterized protein (TIGR02452 family)